MMEDKQFFYLFLMPTYPFSSPGIGEVKLSLQSVDLQIEKENINQKHVIFCTSWYGDTGITQKENYHKQWVEAMA